MLKNLTTIVDSAVIKYTRLAQENETVQSRRFYDIYISSAEGTSTFNTYEGFYTSAITNAGVPVASVSEANILTGPYTAMMMRANKHRIPMAYRQRVVEEQRKMTIDEYERVGDLNNYYRMLSGLPNVGEPASEYITLYEVDGIDYNIYEKYNIPDGEYVHMLTDDKIKILNRVGIIDILIKMYPDKKYLKYIGPNKIKSSAARRANNFALLSVSVSDIPSSFVDKFAKIYEQNREYVNTVLYNKSMADTHELYDNFMALCVMFMTIQRIVSLAFKDGIERDLYDWEFIRRLYESYNIPFIDTLSIDTHMTLVKNFNYLLRYKSTDKVLFDICSLLGYSNIQIDKYYLVKDQRFDADGNPIIVKDENGNIVGSETYDLYFKSVDLKEKNVTLALQDTSTRISYEEVTENDPLWWDSGDLKNTILEEQFNYYESKYITLNMMYNMSDIMFDTTYSLGLMLDQKENIDAFGIGIPLSRVSTEREFSLFDVVVFVMAGLSKMNGFAGNIPTTGSAIASIYGYNRSDFNDLSDPQAQAAIQAWYNRNFKGKYKYDDSAIQFDDIINGGITEYDEYVSSIWYDDIVDAESFNDLFTNVKNLKENLENAMWETDDINMYTAYRALYDIYMTKEYTNKAFTKSDGTIATTYLDYLSDADQDLYNVISSTDGGDMYDILSHAIGRLQEEIESMDNLNMLLDDSETAYKAITSLINFFKSYTVDIHTFNIWYVFDSKYYNAIRLFGKFGTIESNMLGKTEMNTIYSDCVTGHSIIPFDGKIMMPDKLTIIREE